MGLWIHAALGDGFARSADVDHSRHLAHRLRRRSTISFRPAGGSTLYAGIDRARLVDDGERRLGLRLPQPHLEPVAQRLPGWPGSIDGTESARVMVRVSLILLTLCFACDLCRDAVWRTRIWTAMALAGASIAALGLLQRANIIAGFLPQMEPREGSPFATFNYHGNAAAFLNLVLPAAAWLALAGRGSPRSGDTAHGQTTKSHRGWAIARRAARIIPLVLCTAGIIGNVSKAGFAIAILELGALGWLAVLRSRKTKAAPDILARRRMGWVKIAGCIASVSLIIGSNVTGQRWQQLLQTNPRDCSRVLLWRVVLADGTRSGRMRTRSRRLLSCFCPGTEHMIPSLYSKYIVTEHVPGRRVSMWSNAHQDYLQSWIEWGWAGAMVWAFLALTSFGCVLRPSWRPGSTGARRSDEDSATRICAWLA